MSAADTAVGVGTAVMTAFGIVEGIELGTVEVLVVGIVGEIGFDIVGEAAADTAAVLEHTAAAEVDEYIVAVAVVDIPVELSVVGGCILLLS